MKEKKAVLAGFQASCGILCSVSLPAINQGPPPFKIYLSTDPRLNEASYPTKLLKKDYNKPQVNEKNIP